MPSVSLTGADVVQVNGRILTDLADGNPVELSFPNDLATVKVGKNGNVIYAFNNMGQLTEAKIRILIGSGDDKFLNALIADMRRDFSTLLLATGSFSKRVGDGQGNISTVVYQMGGGIVKKIPDARTAAEGDAEQSVVEYVIHFGNGDRSVQ